MATVEKYMEHFEKREFAPRVAKQAAFVARLHSAFLDLNVSEDAALLTLATIVATYDTTKDGE